MIMKHTFHRMRTQMAFTLYSKAIFAMTAGLLLASCNKQELLNSRNQDRETMVRSKHTSSISAVMVDGSVRHKYQINNLKQMSLSMHVPNDGTAPYEVAYTYDAMGRLATVTRQVCGSCTNEYEWKMDPSGAPREAIATYYENTPSGVVATQRKRYGWDSVAMMTSIETYDQSGVLVESSELTYHRNGVITSQNDYKYVPVRSLVRKIMFENKATAKQVAAWKAAIKIHQQPELPWELLTMLCTRMEERNYPTSDDVVVDGRIITGENMKFDNNGLLMSKRLVYPPDQSANCCPMESVSYNYTKISY
jgi:hypothetical protein